jgi:hypothetical protein
MRQFTPVQVLSCRGLHVSTAHPSVKAALATAPVAAQCLQVGAGMGWSFCC